MITISGNEFNWAQTLSAREIKAGTLQSGKLIVNDNVPVAIFDWKDTGALIDKAILYRKDGVEIFAAGEFSTLYGFKIQTGNTFFFGVANDALSNIDSVIQLDADSAYVIGASSILFQIGYGVTEMSLAANQLIFENGGTDVSLNFGTAGELRLNDANWSIETVGKGIDIKEGSNARMGISTLSGGTVTVNTTAVTAASRIFLTRQDKGTGGMIGDLYVDNRIAGTSFDISSADASDDNKVAWIIFEPA